jgi:SAM-dependent methyltransferase
MNGNHGRRGRTKELLRAALSLPWLSVLWFWTLPVLRPPKERVAVRNTFFSPHHLKPLKADIDEIAHADLYLRWKLFDRAAGRIKAWEYGLLHNYSDAFQGLKILDVGPGNSTFPTYLQSKGAAVTVIDLPQPLDPPFSYQKWRYSRSGVVTDQGSVLDLPYEDDSFDLVTCISTIEHLDTIPGETDVLPYPTFIDRTKTALAEMCRVVSPGGHLYITSEVYVPGKATKDRWLAYIETPSINGAYDVNDIAGVFVDTLQAHGFELVGDSDYQPALLLDDGDRSNYRGHFISTFALLARKAPVGSSNTCEE